MNKKGKIITVISWIIILSVIFILIRFTDNVLYYNKDKNQFNISTSSLIADVGPNTYRLIGSCECDYHSIDYCTSYYQYNNHILVGATVENNIDVNTYKYYGEYKLPDIDGVLRKSSLSGDKNHVYFGCGEEVQGIDRNSFKNLNFGYFSDNNGIYRIYGVQINLDNKIIKLNVDKDSFSLLNEYYYKDKNHVYFLDNIIDGADPETFSVNSDSYDSHDKNFKYSFFDLIDKNNNVKEINYPKIDSSFATSSIKWSKIIDEKDGVSFDYPSNGRADSSGGESHTISIYPPRDKMLFVGEGFANIIDIDLIALDYQSYKYKTDNEVRKIINYDKNGYIVGRYSNKNGSVKLTTSLECGDLDQAGCLEHRNYMLYLFEHIFDSIQIFKK